MSTDDRRNRLEEAGRWLRRERLRRGFETAGALAAAIGVDSSRISQYERGMGAVPDDRAELIAEAFGMDIITVRANLGLWVPSEHQPAEPDESLDIPSELERIGQRLWEIAQQYESEQIEDDEYQPNGGRRTA